MAVDVGSTGATFEVGTPKALFDSGYLNLGHSYYHITPFRKTASAFLIPRPPTNSAADNDSSPIVVVLNWAAGIK